MAGNDAEDDKMEVIGDGGESSDEYEDDYSDEEHGHDEKEKDGEESESFLGNKNIKIAWDNSDDFFKDRNGELKIERNFRELNVKMKYKGLNEQRYFNNSWKLLNEWTRKCLEVNKMFMFRFVLTKSGDFRVDTTFGQINVEDESKCPQWILSFYKFIVDRLSHKYNEDKDILERNKAESDNSIVFRQPFHPYIEEFYEAVSKDEKLDKQFKLVTAWKHGTKHPHKKRNGGNINNCINKIYKNNGTLVMQFMVSFYGSSSRFINHIYMPTELIVTKKTITKETTRANDNSNNINNNYNNNDDEELPKPTKKRITFADDVPQYELLVTQGKFCKMCFIQPPLISFVKAMNSFMMSNVERYILKNVKEIDAYVADYDVTKEKRKEINAARRKKRYEKRKQN